MKIFGKSFFETKALWDRAWYSFNGATFWYNTELQTTTALYYKLYRQNTDLRRCIEELYQTVWKDWYILNIWEQETRSPDIVNALNFEHWFWTLMALIIRDLQVAWNVFIIPVKWWTDKVIGFQILDPRSMRVVANKFWEVYKYVQTRWGNTQTFKPWELFHFKDMLDPDNEVLGISKVETLVYGLVSDKEVEKSNYAFFKNNAIPSTLITLDNELSEEEVNLALKTLKTQFSWGSNRHKISASSWIKDVKQLGWGISDMEFVALRTFTTEKVCASMWVPKTILWYSDWVNYSTSDNQYRKYIENTIRPLQNQVQDILNTILVLIDPRVTLSFLDLNEFDFSQKIIDFNVLFGIWAITSNEIREELGYDKSTDENSDKLVVKQWFELVEDIGLNMVEPLQEVPPVEKPIPKK